MIGGSSPIRFGGVSALRGAGGRQPTHAGTAMQTLAGRVAARLAREFDLFGDSSDRRSPYLEPDLYDVKGAARDLNNGLGGGFADEGRLLRTLGNFVTESASLIGARPESRSLERIERAISESEAIAPAIETVDVALATIDRTTDLVTRATLR